MNKHETEPDLTEREITLAYLEAERENWLDLRERVARTHERDAELLLKYTSCNEHMNVLLEELFLRTVEVV
jgi:hypothetical protein